MSRRKSPEALYIESKLKNDHNLRYADLVKMPDYAYDIENAYFNTVKSRFRKVTAEKAFAVVPQVAEFDSEDVSDFEPEYDEQASKLIPSLDPYFAITEEGNNFIGLVQSMSRVNNLNIRLVGPAGCGKTSFATQYAAKNNYPCLIMDCANVREPRDWFGYRTFDPVTKEIVWHESLFVKMVETAHSVIVLDELNRVSPLVINTLIPLLDHRRSTYLEEAGKNISCAEGVTFWAPINEGSQFTGTIALDEAISDRFGLVMECKFLPSIEEKLVLHKKTGLEESVCEKLVDIANQVRIKSQMDSVDSYSKPISTRMLENAARAFKKQGVKSLQFTLLNHFSSAGGAASERNNLRTLLVGKFGLLS
jgi:MoxR-like ATPase